MILPHLNTTNFPVSVANGGTGITNYPTCWYFTDSPGPFSNGFYQKGSSTATDRYTILSPNVIQIDIGGSPYMLSGQATLDLSQAATWDTTSPTNYTTAANRAGLDFYIYACQPVSGTVPALLVSSNSTTPSGKTLNNSRNIGGFHCLCTSVGTIANHTLTGYLQGDILPNSVWDIKFRAESENAGMVYAPGISAWVDIYLMTGTISAPTSVNGASYLDTYSQYDFVDGAAAVKKRLLFDHEFTYIATGCNEATNVNGSGEQNTTGGHSTSTRRMISNIGCEDCAGVLWQWLNDSLTSADGSASWAWKDVTGTRGQVYSQGTYGFYKLIAGGHWGTGANCGSRGRYLNNWAWCSSSALGGRALSQMRNRI